ncbi:cysteine proteinase inhibitor 4-like [Coffea arabica]|uniref:Cysteine proteinase inhibitor 4-like n=1 Tax=Coffea arabica TaxID=13443 RepID=A0ABM4U5M4_COFAR
MAAVAANFPVAGVAKNPMQGLKPALVVGALKQLAGQKQGQGNAAVPDDWSVVSTLDRHIQALGAFAVDEHNKQTNDQLVFVAVLSGIKKTEDDRSAYCLLISAKNSTGKLGSYNAVIIEYNTGCQQLLQFEESP